MTAEPPLIVAGIGCRRGCPVVDIVAAVREAERRAGCRADALAAPGFKQGEAALPAAAAELGLPLHWVGDAELARAQPDCVTRSAVAARATGFAAIAEAAALAGMRTLLLPRITFGAATCALSAVAVDTQPATASR